MNTTELSLLYSSLYSPQILKESLDNVIKFLPEEIITTHPSISLGQDGLLLNNLLLVTKNYFCDLRLTGVGAVNEFDFTAKHSIFNYRIKTWVHEIKEEDVVKAIFELAEVKLVHQDGGSITSLSFAGTVVEREVWLNNLTSAIPVNLVLDFSKK